MKANQQTLLYKPSGATSIGIPVAELGRSETNIYESDRSDKKSQTQIVDDTKIKRNTYYHVGITFVYET